MTAHVVSELALREVVRCARAMLAGQLEILEGCVALAAVADRVVPSWLDDADFLTFGAIASEVDGIPLGAVRQQWRGEALARMDARAEQYRSQVREIVLATCQNVVERFGASVDNLDSESVV